MPNTSIKKIEFFLSDVVLRVTSLEKKSAHVFDLHEAINYKSKENKNVYANGVLEITLLKEKEGSWPNLLVDLPIHQLSKRREESRNRYEQTVHEIEERKDSIRDEYDRKATQQLMRFEQAQRNKLEERKKQEKEEALGQIYSDITPEGKIRGQKSNINKAADWDEKERLANELLEKEEKEDEEKRQMARQLAVKIRTGKQRVSNSMFSSEQIEASEIEAIKNSEKYEEIPVRKAENVSLKFTQKIYPHVATRDTHFIDPPMPKNKLQNKQDKADELQQRNPLWLKDKGDSLLKDKDYISALSAYDKSIGLDNKAINTYLNRSYAHMKLFNFDECISDCESVMGLLQGMIGADESTDSKKVLVKCNLRKAICLAWKGQLDVSKALFSETLNNFRQCLAEPDIADIERSIGVVRQREQSNLKKFEADLEFGKGKFDLSVRLYDESLKNHNNEYSHSNKALVLLKLNQPESVLEECDKALSIINGLAGHLKPSKSYSSYQTSKLLVKVLHRKAMALKLLERYSQGLKMITQALLIDNENRQCRLLHKEIQSLMNKEAVLRMKSEAAELLKQQKIEEALEKYNESLKIVDAGDVMEYLALLQNRCVCYMKLKRWDDIVSTAIRSLNIIHNQQNRLVSFDNTKVSSKEQKQRLFEFEVRILVRRANAYLNLNQIYNAKSDLEKALQISPENQSIKKDLEKVKEELNLSK